MPRRSMVQLSGGGDGAVVVLGVGLRLGDL